MADPDTPTSLIDHAGNTVLDAWVRGGPLQGPRADTTVDPAPQDPSREVARELAGHIVQRIAAAEMQLTARLRQLHERRTGGATKKR